RRRSPAESFFELAGRDPTPGGHEHHPLAGDLIVMAVEEGERRRAGAFEKDSCETHAEDDGGVEIGFGDEAQGGESPYEDVQRQLSGALGGESPGEGGTRSLHEPTCE